MSITNIQFKNCILDEVHIRENTSDIDISSTKETWQLDTYLLAKFLNNLEAGNVDNEGLIITQFAVKRRSLGELTNITLGYLDYNPNDPQTLEWTDFTQPVGDIIYSVVPIGENGLEGKPSSIQIESSFAGWWLVDKNTNTTFEFGKQFGGENRMVDIQLEQGRIEIPTLSKYPGVYYTEQEFVRFSLSAVVVPAKYSVTEWNRLVDMITQHIPLIVKSGNGDIYVCDVSAPSKQVMLNKYANGDPFVCQINAVEIMSYDEYMGS